MRVSYYAFKARGQCGHCGKRKATKGVLCPACAKRHNVGQNQRYRDRVAAGICDWCREPSEQRPDGKHYVYCAGCRAQRAMQPSRSKSVPRGDRSKEYARRNARRRKTKRAQRRAA